MNIDPPSNPARERNFDKLFESVPATCPHCGADTDGGDAPHVEVDVDAMTVRCDFGDDFELMLDAMVAAVKAGNRTRVAHLVAIRESAGNCYAAHGEPLAQVGAPDDGDRKYDEAKDEGRLH